MFFFLKKKMNSVKECEGIERGLTNKAYISFFILENDLFYVLLLFVLLGLKK
jgi:hypothetical protein